MSKDRKRTRRNLNTNNDVKKEVEREGEKVIWMREVEWREKAKRDERKIMEMREMRRMETLRKREQ